MIALFDKAEDIKSRALQSARQLIAPFETLITYTSGASWSTNFERP